ncbi:MAG: hypothetical protein QM704_24465 [Anaeromyxobacteraceae bacterium]
MKPAGSGAVSKRARALGLDQRPAPSAARTLQECAVPGASGGPA